MHLIFRKKISVSLFSLYNNHSINCQETIVSGTLKNAAMDDHSNLYIFYIISSLRSILCNSNFRLNEERNLSFHYITSFSTPKKTFSSAGKLDSSMSQL